MGTVFSICFEWKAGPNAPHSISLKAVSFRAVSLNSASLRRIRSLTPWAIQDSREFLVRTKKFAIKEHIQCKFEGLGSSERCRCEDFKQQKGKPGIVGLHSNWVNEQILATARPSDVLINDYSLLEQFQKCGLGAIFNLQEPGEHGDCGPGIKVESGFSYTPELLMKNRIFYYNFPWRDMTCPSVDYTLNIVAVMDFHISRGAKVAVHCHSGLGRTGLVIACYLVYTGQHHAVSAVELVRLHRHGALQTKQQVLHVKEFEDYLAGLKIVYVQPWQSLDSSGSRNPTLELLMSRQRKVLHGDESRLLRYTPKVLVSIVRELSERIVADKSNREKVIAAFLQGLEFEFVTEKDQNLVSDVQTAKKKLNIGNWDIVHNLDVRILVQLFLDWFHLLEEPVIPDAALSRALSRGEIQTANYELKRGGKCCFYTVRLLACWMLQVVPTEDKNLRRRLFSGLAHVLLHSSTLPSTGKAESSRGSLTEEHMMQMASGFCPSLLEVEFGLLLESAARYWCKILVAQRKLGPVSSISPKLRTSKSDELWLYDKAGVEAEICSHNPDGLEESTHASNGQDIQEYMSTAGAEDVIYDVLLSATPSPVSSRPDSSGMSTPLRG